jgi:hypothetical protein
MAIAKKAKRHFIDQPAVRDRFILRGVSGYVSSGKKPDESAAQKPAA